MELLLLSKVVLFGLYFDDLLVQLSVAPECIVILPSFCLDCLLIQLLVDLASEWSSVVCSSNAGVGSHWVGGIGKVLPIWFVNSTLGSLWMLLLVQIKQGWCNWVHLQTVFVSLYFVCRSVSVLSCVDVIHSFMYFLHVVILYITGRRGKTAREKASSNTNGLSQIYTINKRNEIKQEPLAVAHLLLLTSNQLLPLTVYI